MAATQEQIDQAYIDLGPKFGGSKNDYFPLLYLAQEFGLKAHDVTKQVAFGGKDYGIDAYHIDKPRGISISISSSGPRTTSCSLIHSNG